MARWLDEPGAEEWREQADEADRHREDGVPVEHLAGLTQGREELHNALRLLEDPRAPMSLTKARAAARRALRFIPQSVPDSMCREERWRGRDRFGKEGRPLEVCSRPTCGRCLPLREAGITP